MTEWRKVKLGDICSIKSGKRLPKGADFSLYPTDYKYIRARDIKNGSINDENLAYISQDVQERIAKYIVNTNDVVVTIVGASVGDVAFVSPKFDGINLTENAVRLTDFDERINPQYIFYLLNTKEYFDLMQRVAGGAAQPKLGIYKIEAITVEVPSISKQNHIVRVLSRYDALIENYQRQIKLLEEAAQRLYKEWFVDLRFPGHQSTPIINNLPQSWQKKKLAEIAPIKTGKKDANFASDDGAYPFFTCAQTPIKAPSYSFDENAVILAGNGDFNVKIYRGKFEAYQRTYVLVPYDSVMLYLLFFCVSENMVKLATGASGSTIKFLTKGMIESLDLYQPSTMVLNKFNKLVEQIQSKKENLLVQIRNLSEARDRLLPKLMSAEIEV